MRLESELNRIWYEGSEPAWWLYPLAWLFGALSALRRALYRFRLLHSARVPVPVIVIGNITVGGAGKTPLTIAVIEALKENGLAAGIVTRGYGGRPGREPLHVTDGDVERTGDEPALLAARTGAPVYAHPRRAFAARYLVEREPVDVIVCDDGLQHYALARDIEIAVVDGGRGLGNGRLLPAGPLREPARRLADVHYVVINGELSGVAARTLPDDQHARAFAAHLLPRSLVNLCTGERREPAALATERVAAVAGIANPQRFFTTLANLGYDAECRAFPDHYAFAANELEFAGGRTLLMTEKDAVKCRSFARPTWWYLEVAMTLDELFIEQLLRDVRALVEARRGEKVE